MAGVVGDGLRKLHLARKGCGSRIEQGIARNLWSEGMSEVYDSLMEGLNEALAFARGDKTDAIVHQIAVPAVDVAAIRAGTGLSQGAFARSIGVAMGTLLNWNMAAGTPPAPRRCCLP